MTPEQKVAAVLDEARRYLGVREVPYASNRGTEVDYWVKEAGLDPKGAYPWCACFVGAVGRQAVGRSLWPLPVTASVQALHDYGAAHSLIQTAPQVGDVFLLWESGLKPPRFGHTGFVVEVRQDGSCLCREGNTNPGGSRDGYGVFERVRHFGAADRFLHWSTP